MIDREKVIRAVDSCFDYWLVQHSCLSPLELENIQQLKANALAMFKEQETMIKPTRCPCGQLFDAKDSSFCPKCGCAYGELSGRYTNIGR